MCKGEWPLLLHTKCLILGNKIWFPSLEPLGKSPPDFDRNRELIHIYLTSCSDQSSQDWVGTWVCMLFFLPWIKFLVKQSPLCSKTPAFPGLCVWAFFLPNKLLSQVFWVGRTPRQGVCMLSACWEKEGFCYYMWGVGTWYLVKERKTLPCLWSFVHVADSRLNT